MSFKSDIWKYYSVKQNDSCLALCNNCSAEIARGKRGVAKSFSTTPMWNHLKNSHPDYHKQLLSKKKDADSIEPATAGDSKKRKLLQPSISNSFEAVKPLDPKSEKAQEITRAIGK